jgi:hypothetical protein
MKNLLRSRRFLAMASILCALIVAAVFSSPLNAEGPGSGAETWYKGNIHCHSFWSDGNDFPEMVADWYRRHDYDFLAMSEHNQLQRGVKWINLQPKDHPPIPEELLERCRKRFGPGAVELRERGGHQEARLKTFAEIRKLLEEPGRFLLLENQEISDKFEQGKICKNVHLNAVNAGEVLLPRGGKSVLDVLQRDLRMVEDYTRRTGRTVVVQVNHPTWKEYDITPVELASAVEAWFFEVCNNSPGSKQSGDAEHPGCEKIWDIANTLRIAYFHQPPLWGTASDDAHHYRKFNRQRANPGRGWIVVHAAELAADALMNAMLRGEFYASIGIVLKNYHYDLQKNLISLEVEAEPGAEYTIEFVGTRKGAVPAEALENLAKGKIEVVKMPEYLRFGEVFQTVKGTQASYQLTGDELYVRVVVRSTKKLENPSDNAGGEFQKAWCQPAGWRKWMKEST